MTAPKRKSISKKLRFEVFKRDGFKCQYCGAAAPDVLLEVDHIQPISKEGDHDLLNLITACKPCNLGKSDRLLGDDIPFRSEAKARIDRLVAQFPSEMLDRLADVLVGYGEEYVDPAEWLDNTSDSDARCGQAAWMLANRAPHVHELVDNFRAVGPERFMVAVFAEHAPFDSAQDIARGQAK